MGLELKLELGQKSENFVKGQTVNILGFAVPKHTVAVDNTQCAQLCSEISFRETSGKRIWSAELSFPDPWSI